MGALAAQFLLGGAFIWAAANGFSLSAAAPAHPRCAGPAEAGVPCAAVDRFDERRAWAQLRAEVALGPRPAGSVVLKRLAARLRRELPNGRLEPVGRGLFNVVGSIPGRRPAIVVGAHYDTKDIPGSGPAGSNGFLGANDGAAATAAVVELARGLGRLRRPDGPELRFVLFDGEEEPPGATDFFRAGDRGSKAYVAAHRSQIRAMVLLDFIANRRLRIRREGGSDPALWARLRAAAARVGVGSVFPAGLQGAITDDHTPFARAGIPAIDLIDFDYPCWHRRCDTPAQLSARSLDASGEAVYELLRSL